MTSKARRNRVKELWLGLPESWRTEAASAFHTFIPVFVSSLIVFIQTTDNVSWSKETLWATIVAAFLTALRAGFKAVSVWIMSRTLPDPKESGADKK